MRRKQSKSPTSSDGLPKIKNGILFGAKHKRRILRKRDSSAMTEASSLGSRGWSVGADNALWRVGKSCSLLLGFVICLPPKTAYGSLNYLWFNERYDDFLYVDRIAVSTANRNQKIGSKLYQAVTDTASKLGVPIAAEVNLRPPNPDSVRFHQRHGFTEIGQFEHGQKAVIMMLKQ